MRNWYPPTRPESLPTRPGRFTVPAWVDAQTPPLPEVPIAYQAHTCNPQRFPDLR